MQHAIPPPQQVLVHMGFEDRARSASASSESVRSGRGVHRSGVGEHNSHHEIGVVLRHTNGLTCSNTSSSIVT